MPSSDEQPQRLLQAEPSSDAAALPSSTPFPIESLVNGSPQGQILGQYRVLQQLGSGGMGHVFKAVHQTMDRIVALKVMSPELIKSARARTRFQREVRSAARLSHPNIVLAYDAAEDRGLSFLVMEYVEGADLGSLVLKTGVPPVSLACEIIRQAALGLQHAHEQGMVHRDVKPGNLMLASERSLLKTMSPIQSWPASPNVKILDFGISRLAAIDPDEEAVPVSSKALTREGFVLGTPEFMAPEQARDSRRADIRSDIYSLGCTFYFLLTGRPPFVGATPMDVVVQHNTREPEAVERLRPEVPPGVVHILRRMLAKNPEQRFQTPAAVAEALTPWTGAGSSTPGASIPPARAGAVGGDDPTWVSGAEHSPAVVWNDRLARTSKSGRWMINFFPLLILTVAAGLLIWWVVKNEDVENPASTVNSQGQTFAHFSPGLYQRISDSPGQIVTFRQALDVATTEVTRGQFARFVLETRHQTTAERFPGEHRGSFVLSDDGTWHRAADVFWNSPLLDPNESLPVLCVSWEDAVYYCNWLSEAEQRQKCYHQKDKDGESWHCDFTADGYRLPTSAEWEYFARAGSQNLLPQPEESLREHGWFRENADGAPHPVGQKKANARQMHDVWGNVWEWCWDWQATAPTQPNVFDPVGPPLGTHRTVRGGGWNDSAAGLPDEDRKGLLPDHCSTEVGFRVVRTVKP